MATLTNVLPVNEVRGKLTKQSPGYFYDSHGEQHYRNRREGYQQNQSPRQMWRSASFAYAQQQMANLSPEQKASFRDAFREAQGMTPFGSKAKTASGWRRTSLMFEWQQQHPFEAWQEENQAFLQAKNEAQTAASATSREQLQQQIEALSAQLAALQTQLNQLP